MKVVRHDHELMQEIEAAIAVSEECFNQDCGDFRHLEGSSALPALRRDEVGAAWRGSVLRR